MFDKSEPPRKFETRLKIQISTINHARGIQGIQTGDKSEPSTGRHREDLIIREREDGGGKDRH